jgi:outer membrane receptor for ferrienterochelin and colicins
MTGVFVLLLLVLTPAVQAQRATLRVEVRSDGAPVAAADVVIGGQTYRTNAQGTVSVDVPAGPVDVTVVKEGFAPLTTSITVQANQVQPLLVDLSLQPTVEEHVTVSATRTDKGIEDLPMRVEVLGKEELDEKVLMTPGDIVMMLNEMGGLRVQATSASLGAASVRIQGMRGRYTRFLSDGLPLFGQQVGGLGLLQIPPTDLGQVEVIKGVASALYGAGAMGGVVNLVSRRPGAEPTRDLLVNRSRPFILRTCRSSPTGTRCLASSRRTIWTSPDGWPSPRAGALMTTVSTGRSSVLDCPPSCGQVAGIAGCQWEPDSSRPHRSPRKRKRPACHA